MADQLDRRLIHALQLDARAPVAALPAITHVETTPVAEARERLGRLPR
ncbi:AsnC family protein [Nonomuraea sp. NPDC049421]